MNTESQVSNEAGRRRRRWVFALLALIFLAPVAASFYLYYGPGGWRPSGDVSRGDLILPARPLPALALSTPAGALTDALFLRGKWSLIFIDRLGEDGACAARCREALYQMRQVRLSLNEKADRVQRVLLYSGRCCEEPFFSREHSGLIAASVDSPEGAALLESFAGLDADPSLTRGRIYVSDPLGNLLLSYPAEADPGDVREDLKRLLKLSHIG